MDYCSFYLHAVNRGSFVQVLLQIVDEAKKFKGDIDLGQVQKAVLKTQPPRPGDVGDMCAWVKKWGGLPTGVFLQNIAKMLSSAMPSDRVVSGTFFAPLQIKSFLERNFLHMCLKRWS